MEQDKNKGIENKEGDGKTKEVIILVNSREKQWNEKTISFDQVVILAFGSISNDPNVSYTVTYKKGDNNKPEGILVKGDIVKVKEGMRFNVTQTNRS
ncbi:MAG TPA: multiubiquitin domain-containing protein [Hanamia sp.]|nr:multiubiquitin domain-containing protein [Bacteroidota bacterium]HUZ60312.1 multiubiquitin domain-containing protein [Hanamia sp.]